MISISVTRTGDALERVQKLLDVKASVAEIAKRLCEVGEPIIRATHGNHARVWTEPTENGYKVSAEGEDVLFIEFGTGDLTGTMADKYDDVPAVALKPGSWSEANQGEYWKTGGYHKGHWHFGGQEYHETPPHPAFYDAYQAMVEALPQIAQEVFGK